VRHASTFSDFRCRRHWHFRRLQRWRANKPPDAAVVRDLLNRWPADRPKLPVDGIATPLLTLRG
jgi:hypothetical protein